MIGFIQLHRKLMEWEWYTDQKTFKVFLHCLLKANFKDKQWRGSTIKRGQFVTSISHLASETGLTVKQVRTALDNLESTGEVGKQSTNLNTCITVIYYDKYQSEGKPMDKPKGKQKTNEGQQLNNVNKENKEINILSSLQEPKTKIFNEWLNYRKQLRKPIKVESTLEKLIDKFNSESLDKCIWTVNNSIQNSYTGLFWDNYKEVIKNNNFAKAKVNFN